MGKRSFEIIRKKPVSYFFYHSPKNCNFPPKVSIDTCMIYKHGLLEMLVVLLFTHCKTKTKTCKYYSVRSSSNLIEIDKANFSLFMIGSERRDFACSCTNIERKKLFHQLSTPSTSTGAGLVAPKLNALHF